MYSVNIESLHWQGPTCRDATQQKRALRSLEGDVELYEGLAGISPVRPDMEAVVSQLTAHVERCDSIRGSPSRGTAVRASALHLGDVHVSKVDFLRADVSRLESVL